jgi:hypothetical protein
VFLREHAAHNRLHHITYRTQLHPEPAIMAEGAEAGRTGEAAHLTEDSLLKVGALKAGIHQQRSREGFARQVCLGQVALA